MFRFIQKEERTRDVTIVRFDKPQLSPKTKNILAKVREEVKKGKFSKYNNAKELADELGL